MNNRLFESWGIGNIDIGYIFIVMTIVMLLLIALTAWQMVTLQKWKKKYNSFMVGKRGTSLEKELLELCEDTKELRSTSEENARRIKDLYRRHQTTYQKLGIVKYDAFKEMGGKLSFCLVLLDEQNNGFILNSVHSSDGCYSYTKRVKEGKCDILLGNEEQIALDKAIGK